MEILKGKIRFAQLCLALHMFEISFSARWGPSSEAAVIHLCSYIIILRFATEKFNGSAESKHI